MPNKKHLKRLDLIIASGNKQMEYLSQYVSKEKLAFVPLGIDTDFFRPLANNMKINNSTQTLLHVGCNRRDYYTLKEVFIQLQLLKPEIRLEMVGADNAKIIFQGIKNVIFHPFLTDEELLDVYLNAS